MARFKASSKFRIAAGVSVALWIVARFITSSSDSSPAGGPEEGASGAGDDTRGSEGVAMEGVTDSEVVGRATAAEELDSEAVETPEAVEIAGGVETAGAVV